MSERASSLVRNQSMNLVISVYSSSLLEIPKISYKSPRKNLLGGLVSRLSPTISSKGDKLGMSFNSGSISQTINVDGGMTAK